MRWPAVSPSGFGGNVADLDRRASPVGSYSPGSDPGEVGSKITDGWSTGTHEWCGKSTICNSDDGFSFKQTCNEESGDADIDSFKTAPWDAGGIQGDRFHEVMCQTIVHKLDRWTTRNTECELITNMLIDTDSPRLTVTPGECHASYGGIQIRGNLRKAHDTLAIPDGYTRRKDDRILRRSAVCDEICIFSGDELYSG